MIDHGLLCDEDVCIIWIYVEVRYDNYSVLKREHMHAKRKN